MILIITIILTAGIQLKKGLGKGKRMGFLSSYLRLSAYATETGFILNSSPNKHLLEK